MQASRPVILLGHGVRAAGAAHLVPKVLDWGIPVLASWQAKDMIDHDHRMFMGCPGIYGNRAANKALYEANEVLAIGNRLSIWNVGYEGIDKYKRLYMVDVDESEVRKPSNAHAKWIKQDAKSFIEEHEPKSSGIEAWLLQCSVWREQYPTIEAAHDDAGGYINSYLFFDRLNGYLRQDEIVAIDCGSACASAFQALKTRPPMRLLSSGGLGEMGCALPAAIGASFARNKGEVICIVGDGGLMLNLQDLQTIVHHQLPIKIIVCVNDGYLMIKHTQANAGMTPSGVDVASGVSIPRVQQLAMIFGFDAALVQSWRDFQQAMPQFFDHKGPALIEYRMHPQQKCVPKLEPVFVEGKPTSPRFSDMSPILP
jgi:acetolactate synthase-1/2/3 large subunit